MADVQIYTSKFYSPRSFTDKCQAIMFEFEGSAPKLAQEVCRLRFTNEKLQQQLEGERVQTGKTTLKKSGSSTTLLSVANDLNPERNQALKNIIREKEKEIGVYNAALTELKNDYDKLKKRVFDFEQGD